MRRITGTLVPPDSQPLPLLTCGAIADHNSYNVEVGRSITRSPKASARETTHGRWTLNISGIVQLFLIAFLMAALFAFDHNRGSQMKSILVRGTIQDTRIIADRAVETNWGSQLTWRAEYKVAYPVANREYTMWADSGARGESTADVQLALAQAHRSCWVRYDSQDPAASVADCR